MIINSVIKGSGGGGQRVIEKFYVVGSCTVDNNYIATGFDDSNYLESVQPLPGDKTNWEFGTKIHTKSSISGTAYIAISKNGNIFALGMYNGGNGSNFGDGSMNWYSRYYSLVVVDGTFAADTTYWYKVTYNGARYSVQRSTDGVNFTEVVYMNCDQTIPEAYLTFGSGAGSLVESMDLKETYFKVDNAEIWRAVVIS